MRILNEANIGHLLNWHLVVNAIELGHKLPKAQIGDQFLGRSNDTLLSRAAWIEGLGFGVKSVSVFPGNPENNLPSIQGAMLVFDDENGALEAVIDNDLITNWKTAADSLLGAKYLARSDSETLLIIGAGSVGEKLIRAYCSVFASIKRVMIWNRSSAKAEILAHKLSTEDFPVSAISDLENACEQADIISCATMSTTPVLSGDWVQLGTHVDLIGAFKADMREADDALIKKGKLFVDSFETTLDHIGELKIPLDHNVIQRYDILGDLYAMTAGECGRANNDDITVFKNGGGAHLDLMTAKCIMGLTP